MLMGRKPVLEALKNGDWIEKIWIDTSLTGPYEIEVRALCKSLKIPLAPVPLDKLNKLTSFKNHQGIVANGSQIPYQNIEDLVPHLFEQGVAPKILICDAIEDVRNFAAISRSAVWFGFDAIVTGLKKSAPVNYVSVKISAGAISKIPICRENSLMKVTDYLKNCGFTVYGTDMEGDINLHKMQIEAPIAIVMGSEGRGINRELKAKCDHIIAIPGSGAVDSLNVSVSAALVMNEIYKNLVTG